MLLPAPRSAASVFVTCLATTLVIFGSIFSPASAQAQLPGKVDPAFAPTVRSVGTADIIARQADGKLIVGGIFTGVNTAQASNLARLNADGSLDAGFVPPADLGSVGYVTVGPGGKVFVLSYKQGNFGNLYTLVRLNTDGSQDAGFVPPSFNGSYNSSQLRAFVLAAQADGKVLVGGSFVNDPNSSATTGAIIRYNADGTLDTTFQPAGTLTISQVSSLLLLPSGQLIATGDFSSLTWSEYSRGLIRLNANGSLDESYPNATSFQGGYDLTLQPDGKVLYLRSGSTAFNANSIPYRLNADGSPDASFSPQVEATASFVSLVLQPDGKVVVAGAVRTVLDNSGLITKQEGVVRLNADGSADSTFGSLALLDAGQFLSLGLQTNGQVLVGGDFQQIAGSPRFALTRLNPDGTPDLAFTENLAQRAEVYTVSVGTDGLPLLVTSGPIINGSLASELVSLNLDGSLHTVFAANLGPEFAYSGGGTSSYTPVLAPQPDGKVLISAVINGAGYTYAPALRRFNTDGSQDTGFVPANTVVYGYSSLRSIAPQPDGRIYVAGAINPGYETTTYPLNRLNADGSVDTAFTAAEDPRATFLRHSIIYALAVQPDGRVLAAGGFLAENSSYRYGVLRFNADGSVDPGFNVGALGNAISTQYTYPGSASVLVLQPDGKVLIGGNFASVGGVAGAGVARLNPDGSLDATFNAGTNTDAGIVSLALQGDGKIVLGGNFTKINGISLPGVARLNTDGSVDTQFTPGVGVGSDGYVESVALTPDGSVLVGGSFARFDGQPREGIVRLFGGDVPLTPLVTSAATASGQIGQPFSYQITATNQPTSLGATGLPPGLTVDASTGLISGTPTEAGTFAVTLAAGNLGGTGTATLTLVIAPGLPVVNLVASVSKVTAGSGQKGMILLTRTGGDLSTDLVVNYVVKGTAVNGTDYAPLQGTKKIKAGRSQVAIKIKPRGSGPAAGANQVVKLLLAPGDGYTVGEGTKQKVKIIGQ